MTEFAIAITTHPERLYRGSALARELGAQLFVDTGQGELANHAAAWAGAAASTDGWVVVLEDDALPIEGFREHLADCLAHAMHGVVSLYVGRDARAGLQRKIRIARAVAAERGAAWLMFQRTYWGVGLAAPAPLAREIAEFLPHRSLPYDQALSEWTKDRAVNVFAPVRSLVDHDDELPSLVWDTPREQRVAWEVGAPEWNTSVVRV